MDSPPQLGMTPLLRRQILENPEWFPCWSGVTITAADMAPKFTPRVGCKERCCFPPATTPDGAATPKWAERMAAEKEAEEEASIGRQPVFPPCADSGQDGVHPHR